MARESESRTQAQHITDVILAVDSDSKLGWFIVHLGTNAQCKRKLKQYIKKFRLKLHTVKFKDGDGNLTTFDQKDDEEVLSELYALDPFFNHNQKMIGPKAQGYEDRKLDIMKFTRDDFLDYMCDRFDINDPDSWDEGRHRSAKAELLPVEEHGRHVITKPNIKPNTSIRQYNTKYEEEEVSYYEEECCQLYRHQRMQGLC